MEIQHYLQQYLGIPPSKLEQIAVLFKAEQLKKGDFWLRQGQYQGRMSFLSAGYLHFHAPAPLSGKSITQWIGSPGALIADLSTLLFQAPARWNIEALSPCDLYTISSEHYQQIGQWVPEWAQLEKTFLARCFMTLEERVFHLLSLTAEQRYQALWDQDANLFNQVPLQYLASMMHMTPETLSRIRAKKQT
ncbi:MAG: Crp/Fnr family transcriptional regulator [Aureispira sp.]